MELQDLFFSWGIGEVQILENNTDLPISCDKCNRKFTTLTFAKLHKCPQREVEEFTPGFFTAHMVAADFRPDNQPVFNLAETVFSCPACPKTFKTSAEFVSHFLVQHQQEQVETSKPSHKEIIESYHTEVWFIESIFDLEEVVTPIKNPKINPPGTRHKDLSSKPLESDKQPYKSSVAALLDTAISPDTVNFKK